MQGLGADHGRFMRQIKMTNLEWNLYQNLQTALNASINYGADAADKWFPDSGEVDAAWDYLLKFIGAHLLSDFHKKVQMFDGKLVVMEDKNEFYCRST